MTSPRTAQAMTGKKTIRKTARFRRLTVDGGDGAEGSLFGGPVSPDKLTPRTVSSMMMELQSQVASSAPVPHVSLEGIELPQSPVSPVAPSVSSPVKQQPKQPAAVPAAARHIRQPSMGATGLTRNTTMFVQNLEQLVGGSFAVQDFCLSALGSVKCITSVENSRREGEVWVVHNNPSPDGMNSAPSITVLNRDNWGQKYEVSCLPEATINNVVFAGKLVYLATSYPDLICINPDSPMSCHKLKCHSDSITDLACMGKTLWTIGADQRIGVWDTLTMKLRKQTKVKGVTLMNCIIRVAGHAWIATEGTRGILRYNTETLKLEEDYAAIGEEASKYAKMSVSKLLLVNNYVWAAHDKNNTISVWNADNKTFVTAFSAHDVVSMLHVGSLVWIASHDSTIRCFNISSFAQAGTLNGENSGWVTCLAAIPYKDNTLRVWSGSSDTSIVLWDASLRTHDFVTESAPRQGVCEVCKKTLKSFGSKVLRCRNCRSFAIHVKCLEYLPCGCTCSALVSSSSVSLEHSVAASSRF